MYYLSYKKLSKILKKIAKKYKNNSIIFNIPYLHFVRGHPKFSFIYPEVFQNNQFSERSEYNLFFKIKKNLNFLNQLPEKNKFKVLSKKKVLILSNLINKNDFSSNSDIYTNDLQVILNKKKITNLKVLRNFTPNTYRDKSNKIVLPKLNFLSWEIITILKILKERIKTQLFFKKKKDYFTKTEKYFFKKSINFINLFGSLSTLRIINQIENIINIVKPNTIFLPIEGHIWEKSLIMNIKSKYKMIKIIGIQFSSIIENDYTMQTSLGDLYEPHQLICNKYLNYLIIKKKKLFKNSDIIYNNLLINKTKPRINKEFHKIKCLVVPELNIVEVNNFIELIKNIKNINKEIKFTLNLHPQTSKEDVKSIKDRLKYVAKVSIRNLENEIKSNNVLIYRGSTACFKAAEEGLWLLYYNTGKFNINPLHELKLKKNNFSNIIEFSKIIDYLKFEDKHRLNKIFYPKKNQVFKYEN